MIRKDIVDTKIIATNWKRRGRKKKKNNHPEKRRIMNMDSSFLFNSLPMGKS
jgi:hypothetical protein